MRMGSVFEITRDPDMSAGVKRRLAKARLPAQTVGSIARLLIIVPDPPRNPYAQPIHLDDCIGTFRGCKKQSSFFRQAHDGRL
jgi:hypothetical protein